MTVMSVTEARKDLFNLVDKVHDTHREIIIKGKRCNAILISEDDWHSIQETLLIFSIPKLKDSILEASKEPLENFVEWKSS